MTLKEYAKFRQKTKKSPAVSTLAYLGLGIAGESGEVADAIKKYMRDSSGTTEDYLKYKSMIVEELGDVLWYWTGLCEYLDVTPEDVMQRNKKKLIARYVNKCEKN